MEKKLVIFDMDGTILDTLVDLMNSLNVTLEKYNLPTRSYDEVKSFVGNGIKKLIERAVPEDLDAETFARLHNDFMAHYQVHCQDETRPYAGIVEAIDTLRKKGYATAVVSNKADAAVHPLCDTFFPGLFDVEMGEREGVAKKPDPAMCQAVLAALSIKKEDAIYIGDSEVDLTTAANAGLPCIAVTWGFRGEAFLQQQGARHIAHTPEEMVAWVEKLIRIA